MFVSSYRFEYAINSLSREIERERERYRMLSYRHNLLLQHLGLYEHEITNHTVLLSKDGPEPSM